MRKRLGVRPYTEDQIKVAGELDIRVVWYLRLLARLSGMLVPYQGQGVPVTVRFSANPDDARIHWQRRFEFPNREPVRWTSSACAQETPVSTSEFDTKVKAVHPLFGPVVAYSGRFKRTCSTPQ